MTHIPTFKDFTYLEGDDFKTEYLRRLAYDGEGKATTYSL